MYKRLLPIIIFQFLVIVTICHSQAVDTIVLEAQKDNVLYDTGGADTLSNGMGLYIFAGKAGIGYIHRSVIFFELPDSVPPTAIVRTAQMELNRNKLAIGGNGRNINIHRLNANWGEGNSNAPSGEGQGAQAEPGDATWYHTFYDTATWASNGGDFQASPSATWLSGNTTPLWGSNGSTVADVQGWLAEPDNNFGWLLKMENEGGGATSNRFDSRNSPNPALRPMLTFSYATKGIFAIQLDGAQAGTASGGSGVGMATYDAETRVVTVTGRYSGLVSNTTAAHVHDGDSGTSGPVIFPLTLTPGADTAGTFFGSDTLTIDQGYDLLRKGLYVNIHTSGNPAGEIRGQILLKICPDSYEAEGFPIPSFTYGAKEISTSGDIDGAGSVRFEYENEARLDPGFESELGGVLEVVQKQCQ